MPYGCTEIVQRYKCPVHGALHKQYVLTLGSRAVPFCSSCSVISAVAPGPAGHAAESDDTV